VVSVAAGTDSVGPDSVGPVGGVAAAGVSAVAGELFAPLPAAATMPAVPSSAATAVAVAIRRLMRWGG
jgi:hypothetical protein